MKSKAPQKNWLEWTVFAVGSVLVLGTLGFLAQDAWTGGGTPIRLEIELGEPEPRQGHFAVPVTVFNRGGESAEQVAIEVTLTDQKGNNELATLQFAFLPRLSARKGWVAFLHDPSQASQLTARPLGYESP